MDSDVHLMLGKLLAHSETSTTQRAAMFAKLDVMDENITKLAGSVQVAHDNHAALKSSVDRNVMPVIDDMKALKNKGIGVIATVGLIGGSVGGALAAKWTKLIGP